MYCELVVVGVIPLKTGLPLVGHVLTSLVAQDKNENNISNTAIIVRFRIGKNVFLSKLFFILSFCKHCGDDFAGLTPTSFTKLMKRYLHN